MMAVLVIMVVDMVTEFNVMGVVVVVKGTSRYRVLLRYSPSQAPVSTKTPPLLFL